MRLFLAFIIIHFSAIGFAQVGINTTTPNAQLEIQSSNQGAPSNTDGILIPKVDSFPAINPTVSQNGMLVFLTTVSGSNQPGFYYWDNATTSWVGITSTKNADADFYEVGGTNAPDNVNDEMYHLGNVVIGRNANFYANNSRLFVESPDTFDRGIVNYRNLNATSGIYKSGIENFVLGTNDIPYNGIQNNMNTIGAGSVYGVANSFSAIGIATGNRIGIGNYFGLNTSGTLTGLESNFFGIGDGINYGSSINNVTSGNGIHYGNYSLLGGSGNGIHYGNFSILNGSGTGEHYGTSNVLTGNGTANNYGTYNSIQNTSDGTHYATFNTLNGTGAGNHYGNYSEIVGTGTGQQFGTKNLISNTGNAIHIGTENEFTDAGTGEKFGVRNLMNGTGNAYETGVRNNLNNNNSQQLNGVRNFINANNPGAQIGTHNSLLGNNVGDKIGTWNVLNNTTGSGYLYGNYTVVSGSSNSPKIGSYNWVQANGSQNHYCMLNTLIGNATTVAYGLYNSVSAIGTGSKYGVYNHMTVNDVGSTFANYSLFDSTGNANQYGNYINNANGGTGIHWGSYNWLSSNGSGNQAGSETFIDNSGNGNHFGTLNNLYGTGTGNKFGSYNYIDASSGGVHYGLLSEATQAFGYAGLFYGNVYVSGTFTNPSDIKLKENIKEVNSILPKINALQVKEYNFKKDLADRFGFTRNNQTGFIAQELETVFPELVKNEKLILSVDSKKISESAMEETEIKSINYIGLIPYLTKAIQEQQEIINSEKEKITKLEYELEEVKNKLNEIFKRL